MYTIHQKNCPASEYFNENDDVLLLFANKIYKMMIILLCHACYISMMILQQILHGFLQCKGYSHSLKQKMPWSPLGVIIKPATLHASMATSCGPTLSVFFSKV